MLAFATSVAAAPLVIAFYAYVVYPAVLLIMGRGRVTNAAAPSAWPTVTITVPVYNAVHAIGQTLERLLALDYPREKVQIIVLSDACTDGTDDAVRTFESRGVELIRSPTRIGKTAAENAAVARARGDIIVNVDATVIVPATSLKALVAAFQDPTVGVASGRDVSAGSDAHPDVAGEAGYVGYEMLLRDLETKVGTIVGASGCFFAIRREVHAEAVPPELSWDFASVLAARRLGFRAVSVGAAVCVVPRSGAIRAEFRRKARTMARGLATLFHFRELMNPFRYGVFAFMLLSHKLLRWLPYLLTPFSLLALAWLATRNPVAGAAFAVTVLFGIAGVVALRSTRVSFRPLAAAGFLVAVATAGFLAWFDALRGVRMITWNPTTRASASAA